MGRATDRHDAAAPVNRLQVSNLRLYLHFRERPMTVAGLLSANRRLYLLLLLFFAGVGVLVAAVYGTTAAAFVAVTFATVVLRDIAFYRRSAEVWPVLRQVLDWDRVEQLVSRDETGHA